MPRSTRLTKKNKKIEARLSEKKKPRAYSLHMLIPGHVYEEESSDASYKTLETEHFMSLHETLLSNTTSAKTASYYTKPGK